MTKKKHYGIYVPNESPLIEKLDKEESISAKLLEIIEDYYAGKFDSMESENIDDKIKRQKFLKLCLENWRMMKYTHIEEEAKAIILGKKELEAPTIQTLMHKKKHGFYQNKFEENPYCQDCGHDHYQTGIFNCRTCNCGIRG